MKTTNSKLSGLLKGLKMQGKTAFIPYITVGDPNLQATALFVEALERAGATILELGVPFSDPMADGPTNQRAAERALKQGVSLKKVIALIADLRKKGVKIPIVLFTYFNPVFVMGVETFAQSAAQAGADAALVLDLPPEEAGEYRAAMARAGLETIFLAAPTSDATRLELIDAASTGFVYYVSRTGVTGTRASLPESLGDEIAKVRASVRNPLAVGFGISNPSQARTVAAKADAVVVGSALVKIIEENPDPQTAAMQLEFFARSLVAVLQ